jgi:hypothetical protein
VCWHAYQVRGVNQSADHDGVSSNVDSEGHLISLPNRWCLSAPVLRTSDIDLPLESA